ncbi:hypothetical protein ACPC58_01285 [Streptococcus sp. VTCC 12905]
MKIGYRKPSVKKSLSARTTGRAKRMLKSSINPTYGKNGMGLINNPKKAVYNKIYNQTTSGYQEFLGHNKEQNFSETTGGLFALGCISGMVVVGIPFLILWYIIEAIIG